MPGNEVASFTIYLLAGMRAEFEIAFNENDNLCAFCYTDPYVVNGEEVELVNGFYVEDEEVGEITAIIGKPAVEYLHKKAERNSVYYVASDGSKAVFNVIAVPIHDHSTIVQGGPAYGTYFIDSEED
jgi:hypothetical protein